MANDDWITPMWIADAARRVMGRIDLDPASSHEANEIIQADHYYTKHTDGLNDANEWTGNVWLNPPYSQPACRNFCNRLHNEYENQAVDQALLLLNNGTETVYMQNLLVHYPFVLLQGRVSFLSPHLEAVKGNRQGQIMFYLGPHEDRFIDTFSDYGNVCRRCKTTDEVIRKHSVLYTHQPSTTHLPAYHRITTTVNKKVNGYLKKLKKLVATEE